MRFEPLIQHTKADSPDAELAASFASLVSTAFFSFLHDKLALGDTMQHSKPEAMVAENRVCMLDPPLKLSDGSWWIIPFIINLMRYYIKTNILFLKDGPQSPQTFRQRCIWSLWPTKDQIILKEYVYYTHVFL